MAGVLQIGWSNEEAINKFAGAVYAVGNKLPIAAMRAANHTGGKAKTKVVRALTQQTGLKRKTIVNAVKPYKASTTNIMYAMHAKGGDVALKYFGARETRSGVSANPFGKRQVYGGTFIQGGSFPNRTGVVGGGQVFERLGKDRLPIAKIKSGVIIPNEMIKGETQQAFEGTVRQELAPRLYHELKRLMP